MICLGPADVIMCLPEGFKVYNYMSTLEGLEKLNLLPPPVDQSISDFDFDMYYANWLMNDSAGFRDLMRVMYDNYSGWNIYLTVNMDLVGNIAESFMKFVQQRYGVNCYVINSQDDLMCAIDSGASFSTLEGLSNFDYDKERVSVLAEAAALNNQKSGYEFVLGDDNG
jgi:hypothetical protein